MAIQSAQVFLKSPFIFWFHAMLRISSRPFNMSTTDANYPEIKEEVKEMTKVFGALGLAVILNFTAPAQKQQRSADVANENSPKKAAAAAPVKGSKRSGTSESFSAVSNLQAQLQNTLDVRNAKVGDEVVLKTTQSIKQDGQVVIPKGSRLIGRVTDVQQRAKNGAASKLGLVFDQLQNGQMLTPITASVVSITNANAGATLGDTLDSDLSGSSSTTSRTSSGGSGGGLLGGVTNTVGSVANTAGQTLGGVTNTAGQALGTATSTAGRTINGLQISTSASGSAQSSTTLSSPNNNVRLEKGVTFNMNVQRSGGN